MTNTNTLADLGWSAGFQSQMTLEEVETHLPVRITDVHRRSIDVVGEHGPERLQLPAMLADVGVAVGDWVLCNRSDGLPERLLERKSLLKRGSAGERIGNQLIAANVDTLFIVSSCNDDFNVARLERYLAMAHQAGVTPVILLTKSDLSDDPADFVRRAVVAMPDVPVEAVNAKATDLAGVLGLWCRDGQTVALVGSSGVGKSTLANALTGQEILTQDIREDDAKGRHTTTARSMYRMLSGGWLIDTPGMRSITLVDASEGVEMVFQDIVNLTPGCRFSDCQHESEPGCAVNTAVGAGELDAGRVARWKKLLREEAFNSSSLADLRANRKKWAKIGKTGKARGKAKRGGF